MDLPIQRAWLVSRGMFISYEPLGRVNRASVLSHGCVCLIVACPLQV